MAAYDYLLQGVDHYHKNTREDNALAIDLLEKAISLDPNYAQAYAWLACILGQGKYNGYIDERIDEWALQLLEKARDLDKNDSEIFRILAAIHINMGDHEKAEIFLNRAIALNPNDPKILCLKCDLLIWKGQPDEGLEWLEAAKRRDPNMYESWWRSWGRAKFELKDYETAIKSLNRISRKRQIDLACIAASFASLGRASEAKLAAANIINTEPEFSVNAFIKSQPFFLQESKDHLAKELLKSSLR